MQDLRGLHICQARADGCYGCRGRGAPARGTAWGSALHTSTQDREAPYEKLVVDLTKCQGYAQCAFLAPDASTMHGDEALMYDPDPDDEQRRQIMRAAAAGPVQAVQLDREDGPGGSRPGKSGERAPTMRHAATASITQLGDQVRRWVRARLVMDGWPGWTRRWRLLPSACGLPSA